MAKYFDYFTKFKSIYFISTKDKALTFLVKIVQGFVKPLGLCLLHLRANGGGEFTADYHRDNCTNTATIQEFRAHNTSEQNDLSERDGRTIIDVARCMLNGSALPKSLWGEMAATAVFLLIHPPGKTVDGDTSYYRMFDKLINLPFLRTIGTHPREGR